MSAYRTSGTTTDSRTGLPVPSGVIYVTTSGLTYSTVPVGEAPGGFDSTPGIASAAIAGISNTGWNHQAPGVPYGFSAPVYIGFTQ